MPALTFDDVPDSGVSLGPNGIPRVTIDTAPKAPGGALTFDDIPTAEPAGDKVVRYAKDVGRSIVSGLDKGVAGLAGLPADLTTGGLFLRDVAQARYEGRPFDAVKAENEADAWIPRDTLDYYGGKAMHERSGLKHEPETTAGKYAQSAAEFVPSAIIPGASVRNALALGVVPGLASEAAGQATEGTAAEPWARAGAALAAGGAGVWFNAPNSAGASVSRAARGANQSHIDEAETLFQAAQQMGIPITRAEAVQHVTGGATNLGNLQRVVEGSGEMRPFFAQRPGRVENSARGVFDELGPPSQTPSSIGPAVGQAAEAIVGDTTRAINRASRPYYQAAEAQRVGPQVHQAIIADPLYAQTLNEVRANPALNRTIEHLPDDSVGVIDLVQRRMREAGENARVPGQANTSNLAAANFEDARTVPLAAADTLTGSRAATSQTPAVAGSYETARNMQQQMRDRYLEPLLNGPIGKMAANDTTTKKAIEVLFPSQPLANSEREIGQAVAAVAQQNPYAARELVRAHVEGVFNEAVQRLQSGANEFGGAGFAAVLRGNPQQAANLEAAITALRGGQTYQGFDRFLTILEAMGSRQRVGSQTAFNQEVQSALKEAGTVATVLSGAATGGVKFPQQVRDAIQRWRLGENVGQIADVLTNPQAAALFRQLATAPGNSAKAAAVTTRLVYLAERGRENSKAK